MLKVHRELTGIKQNQKMNSKVGKDVGGLGSNVHAVSTATENREASMSKLDSK